MTQLPQTGSEALSPVVDVEPAVLDRVADAIFREYADERRPAPPGESIWTRYARAAITAMPSPAPALDVPLGAGAVVRTKSDRSTTPAGSIGMVIGQAANGGNRYSVMFPGDPMPLSLPAKDLDVVRGLNPQSWWKKRPADGLPRDWGANEVGPNTPSESPELRMAPDGRVAARTHRLAGGDEWAVVAGPDATWLTRPRPTAAEVETWTPLVPAALGEAAERLAALARDFRDRAEKTVVSANPEKFEDGCDSPAECHASTEHFTWKLAALQVEKLAESLATPTTGPAQQALTAADGRERPDVLADFGCEVVMTGDCRYFTDRVHRCCVAPLGEAAHGTASHPHSCMCDTQWATVPRPTTDPAPAAADGPVRLTPSLPAAPQDSAEPTGTAASAEMHDGR